MKMQNRITSFWIATLLCTLIFSEVGFAQSLANLNKCLKALNNHKVLKLNQINEGELKKLAEMNLGVSNNDLALFILTSGRDINENCPKNVTDYFVGKFDTSFILNVKRLAAQGNCADIAACNRRAREYEAIVRALNGGSAGLSRANLADIRYTTSSSGGSSKETKKDDQDYSVCCSGPMSGKVNAGYEGGGYCENNETIYPCDGSSSEALKENDPRRAAFYKRFKKDHEFSAWTRKFDGGRRTTTGTGDRGPIQVLPASGVGR